VAVLGENNFKKTTPNDDSSELQQVPCWAAQNRRKTLGPAFRSTPSHSSPINISMHISVKDHHQITTLTRFGYIGPLGRQEMGGLNLFSAATFHEALYKLCICQLSPSDNEEIDHRIHPGKVWTMKIPCNHHLEKDGWQSGHLRCKTCGSHKLKSLDTFMGYLHIAGPYQGRFSRWFVLFPRCDMLVPRNVLAWPINPLKNQACQTQCVSMVALHFSGVPTSQLIEGGRSTKIEFQQHSPSICSKGWCVCESKPLENFPWQPKLIFWIYPVSEKMEDWNSQVTTNFDIASPSLHELNIVYVPRH